MGARRTVVLVAVSALVAYVPVPAGSVSAASPIETRCGVSSLDEIALPRNAYPWGITAGSDGNIWFPESDLNTIVRMSTDGSMTVFPAAHEPLNMASGADGDVWFTQYYQDGSLGRIDASGTITQVPVPFVDTVVNDIAAGSDGSIWYTNAIHGTVGRLDPDGSVVQFATGWTQSIAVDPDGNAWYTRGDVYRITPSGEITGYPVSADGGANQVSVAGDGTVWFTTSSSIGHVRSSGSVVEWPAPGSPFDITQGPGPEMWFSEYDGNKIGRVSPGGRFTDYPVPTPASGPFHIVTGSDGGIWFTEINADKIGHLTAPASQPDLSIRRGPPSPFLGSEVCGSSGRGQSVRLELVPGSSTAFEVRVRNRGFLSDTVRVQGSGSHGGVHVSYFSDRDITRQVVGGDYATPELEPGRSSVIVAIVTASRRATPGQVAFFSVTGVSASDVVSLDTTVAEVSVVQAAA